MLLMKPAQATYQPPAFKTVMHGFASGLKVSYRIYDSDGRSKNGEVTSDDGGTVVLPIFEYTQKIPESLVYDISITDPSAETGAGRSIDVTMTFDNRSGTARLIGKGLKPSSDIFVQNADAISQSRSDWAGIFKDSDLPGFTGDEPASFKLAFTGDLILKDIPEQSPMIIEVVMAPGGGGPTAAGVNQYTTFNCGFPVHSGCLPTVQTNFIVNIVNNYVAALQLMTEQFSAVMMNYAFIVGTYFDAAMQLETQRELQVLQAQAHKDYHPSEMMCEFGTFVRTVARTEEKANIDKLAMNAIFMTEYTGMEHAATSEGTLYDTEARIKQFREKFCDPADNNNGLRYMCQHDPSDGQITNGEDIGAGADGSNTPERLNADIDVARSLFAPLTLDLNFSDDQLSDHEEMLLAMGRHLYWPKPIALATPDSLIDSFPDYQNARSLFAQKNVAHNSLLEIAGMKASSLPGNEEDSGWNFMKALLKDFGLEDEEIHTYLGSYPSYYAQMEVLTKKIYQNPDFYTNLYDKPANVERIGAALDAFKMMQTRDLYESSLRKEMLTSLLVERALAKHYKEIDAQIQESTAKIRYQ